MRTAPLFNAPVAAVATSPRLSRLVNRNIAILSYTGRRSGRSISMPVAYRRAGDEVMIAVAMPDAKTWWRNFLADGSDLTLRLGETDHHGHAVAKRDNKGRVTVTVRLAD